MNARVIEALTKAHGALYRPASSGDVLLFEFPQETEVWLWQRAHEYEIFFDLVGMDQGEFYSLPENRADPDLCGIPIWGY